MPYRDIKFRAWDKQHKEMTMVNTLSFNLSTMNRNEEYRLNYIIEFKLGSLVRQDGENMMQYIGLKDGHGKEIYEGDIVKDQSNGNMISVTWNDERCGWNIDKKKPLEIIGNIYQNHT